MYKSKILVSIGFAVALAASAEIPNGYYSVLNGKSGDELKAAVKKAAIPDDYTCIEYGDADNNSDYYGGEQATFMTWQAFATTDVRTINGIQIWWDMYSNQINRVENGHSALNIEHSVANSWWGGKDGNKYAYCDLMHLNPSDASANNAKSDSPLAVVGTSPTFDNGMSLIGAPAAGYGGGSSKVFEPTDEYKGDFARAYLYIFTAYNDISWLEDKGGKYMLTFNDGNVEMQQWVVDMLLDWAAKDPVDDKEINRNNEIYKCQKNRNPFIDYPSLPEYLWGSKAGETFYLSGNEASSVNRPTDPTVNNARMTNVNTYSISYWGDCNVEFNAPEGDLWISLDGGNYQQYGSSINLPAGTVHNTTHTLQAYALQDKDGYSLRSSIVTVNLTVKDPDVVDYSTAIWTPTATGETILAGEKYIIVASENSHVMSMTQGSSGFMTDAGAAEFDNDDICILPQDAATVDFIDAGNGNFAIHISDIYGNGKGYWSTTAAKKMKLDASQGVASAISISDDLSAVIDFDCGGSSSLGTLQYNGSSPRFLNYTSSQTAVKLYRFKEFASEEASVKEIETTEIPVMVSGRDIIAPTGSSIFDLNGRCVSGQNLQTGVYIVATPTGTVKIYIR